MKRIGLLVALVAATSFSTSALADMRPTAGPLGNQSETPPNCTLDPWTGRLICHIWPTCTLDPFTGKMNCPVPRLTRE